MFYNIPLYNDTVVNSNKHKHTLTESHMHGSTFTVE